MARMITLFVPEPWTINPPIITLSPVCTKLRVLILPSTAPGVGLGGGVAVGVGDALTTVTVPTIPKDPCGVQKYGNDPTLLKVCVNMAPWLRIPESQIPFGEPGEPDVVLWPL